MGTVPIVINVYIIWNSAVRHSTVWCEEAAMENDERIMKTVDDSRTEQVHILFPRSLNSQGRLYGGELLAWLDEIAGIVARRHSGMDTVTASIDRLDFKAGASLGDTVYINGYLTYVGKTSMEVRIDSYVEEPKSGMRRLINTAFFVMVALGQDGKPAPVPGLKIRTINEQQAWESGKRRKELSKHRRTEGY